MLEKFESFMGETEIIAREIIADVTMAPSDKRAAAEQLMRVAAKINSSLGDERLTHAAPHAGPRAEFAEWLHRMNQARPELHSPPTG